jgi:integrase
MWTDGELRRRFPDVVEVTCDQYAGDVKSKLARYVLPIVGRVPVASFALGDAQRVMERLPGNLSKSTRKHTANFMRRVLTFAVYPLQLIATNPIPANFIPKAGRGRERNMLFVDEDRALLGCTATPIVLRLLFGFQAREGMRRNEVCSLEWRDVDLKRGWVYLDKNKTDEPRDWPLDPDVVEALARWRALTPKARYVFGDDKPFPTSWYVRGVDGTRRKIGLAKELRACLARAGVRRPQLHEATTERMVVGTHDLRATFVTLALARGKSEGWIRRRTGHTTPSMIERYRRKAENLAEGEAATLDPLWQAIPELHVHVPTAPEHAAGDSGPRFANAGFGGSSLAAIQNDEGADFSAPSSVTSLSGKRGSNPRPSAWEVLKNKGRTRQRAARSGSFPRGPGISRRHRAAASTTTAAGCTKPHQAPHQGPGGVCGDSIRGPRRTPSW